MKEEHADILKIYMEYIHLSKYSRWIPEQNRREFWPETVGRYIKHFKEYMKDKIDTDSDVWDEVEQSILNFEVMPSMRALMTAGKALERDHMASYNCSSISITHPRCFDECFYILMCGTGFGFSVERQYIANLPEIAEEMYPTDTVLNVRDSKIGWATALKELISMLYNGQIPTWNLDKVRPAGARLKVFGGRASGPEPLDRLMQFVVRVFTKAKGRKLNSIECHDLICKIADTVIVGSVRRAACISLSNLTDDRMRRAKMGQWWMVEPQRALANNSVAYTEKPDLDSFSKEWRSIYRSKAGERGIINKEALKEKAESTGREYDGDYLTNPCGETILRDSGGLCNLSEVVIRPDDTIDTMIEKVKVATIIGTIQATLTDFRYVRKIWKNNAEEERLLGVSLTGIMDHEILSGTFDKKNSDVNFTELTKWLEVLHEEARKVNKEWAKILGINATGHVTLTKPSGTVSQLCNTSSGIHPRYSRYYIRRVRNDKKDPLSQLMIDQGIPYIEEGEKYVFEFPIKSPPHSVCAEDLTALDQLNLWSIYREVWCDGNPSQTVYYTDNEFFIVADWIWNNWDMVGGLSFFPTDDNVYENAPYESINEEMYTLLKEKFPREIDWLKITEYEKEDSTEAMQTFACSGGACEM